MCACKGGGGRVRACAHAAQEVLGFRCSWENSKNIVTPRLVLKRPSGIPRCQEHLFGLGHRASSFLTYKTGIVLVPTQ